MGLLPADCCPLTAGTTGFRTGTNAHHCRSCSVIFPRTTCFPLSGIGAPSFTHFSSAAIWSEPSFLFFGGIWRSASV